MQKIIVVDKDSSTLNDISRLVTSINFEPIVAYNFNNALSGIGVKEIAAVFIDVETKMVNPRDLQNYLNSRAESNSKTPVIFMYTNRDSKLVEEAMQVAHDAELQKPFSLEELFELLQNQLNLNQDDFTGLTNYDKLDNYERFAANMDEWLSKLGTVLNG